jgi:hypothetical protein
MNEYVTLTKVDGYPAFNSLIESINTYLEKNRGATADFTLIKDMVDRHVSVMDEQITNQLQVPLYLGLVGTMIGIIAGLFAMPTDFESEIFTSSIGILISGVKIAMIAALVGLVLTIISSTLLYKKAQSKLEGDKNRFYSFLQANLLPVLNQNANTGFAQLHRNLEGFNSTFQSNLERFDGFMNRMTETSEAQTELVRVISQTDMLTVTDRVISVLDRLKTNAVSIEKFDSYLSNINSFVGSANELNRNISLQLQRTNEITDIASSIKESTHGNARVMELVKSELTEIEGRKLIMASAVQSVDTTLSNSLTQLKKLTEEKIKLIEEIAIKESDRIDGIMRQDRHGTLSELKNLSTLSELGSENSLVLSSLVSEVKSLRTELSTLNSQPSEAPIVKIDNIKTDTSKFMKRVAYAVIIMLCLVVLFVGWLALEKLDLL